MRTIKLMSLLLLLLAVNKSYSQGIFSKRNVVNQYSSVGIGGGSSHYWGDLSPLRYAYLGAITLPRWNGTVNYTRYLTPNFAARFAFSYIRITGDDYKFSTQWGVEKFAGQFVRNLHFRNDIKEFTISGIYNLTNQYGKGPQNRVRLTPYIMVGIGFYGHNPMARGTITDAAGNLVAKASGEPDIKNYTALAPLKTSGQIKPYGAIQLVAPVGLGLKYRLNDKWDISAEAGLRITPFDYLDDVGDGLYPSASVSDPVFTNRSTENYEARTGESRIPGFNQAIPAFGLVSGNATPFTNNSLVGENGFVKTRGTKAWDYYGTVQVTLNYILSNKIKCPPIK